MGTELKPASCAGARPVPNTPGRSNLACPPKPCCVPQSYSDGWGEGGSFNLHSGTVPHFLKHCLLLRGAGETPAILPLSPPSWRLRGARWKRVERHMYRRRLACPVERGHHRNSRLRKCQSRRNQKARYTATTRNRLKKRKKYPLTGG